MNKNLGNQRKWGLQRGYQRVGVSMVVSNRLSGLVNRPGVAGAVLQTASLLVNSVS